MSATSQSPPPTEHRLVRSSTLLITNIGKLVGVAITINEVLIRPTMRESAVAVAALFFAGAEAVERSVIKILNNILASSPEQK